MSDPVQIRLLEYADVAASQQLGREAFGHAGTVPPLPETWPAAGDHVVGAFADGVLIGKVVGRGYGTHFAGVEVPTWGVAGVTVRAESRGRGALTALFAESFAAAREQGALISTLFPTAPGIYRRFGYEIVGGYVQREIPTADLAAIAAPPDVRLRRATALDAAAIRRVRHQWAREQHGPLTRVQQGATETDQALLDEQDAITLAIDAAGEVIGYAAWDRGPGYDSSATLVVEELIALTPDAARALWSAIGSFRSVTGHVRVTAGPDDVHRLVLPSGTWREIRRTDYMLAVLDICGAWQARRIAPGITAELTFRITDHPLADQNGDHRLRSADGRVHCERFESESESESGSGSPREISARGLAVLYAGTQSCANLRLAGLLSGGDPAEDAVWDLFGAGRQFHVHDYF